MLNNIPMIRLLAQYGGEESVKSVYDKWWFMIIVIDYLIVQPEECRYQSVCYQLTILSQQNLDETIKKSSSNKLTADDAQVFNS
jgi:hypothetical protein